MAIASILIPVWNRESEIQSAIDSALAQTVRDIEVVIVDNCSSDRSFEVATESARLDKRVRAYRNSENIGPVRNWQRCAELAATPFSKILFSDDLLAPTFLEKTLPELFASDCGLVYCPAQVGTAYWSGVVQYKAFLDKTRIGRDYFLRACLLVENFAPYSPGACLLRTEDLRKNLYANIEGVTNYDFSRSGAGVDWLLYLLTACAYKYVSYIPEPLVFFLSHQKNLSFLPEFHASEGYDIVRALMLRQLGIK